MVSQDAYGSSVVLTSPRKHHGNFILPNSGGGAGLTTDLSLYHSRRHPLSGNSRTCATCFKSPQQVSVWVQIRQETHPEDFCNHGGVGRMARAGGMSDKSTPGANPSKLLSFSFKRSLLGSQRSPYWVVSVAHGSPETLPQTDFSFSIHLSSLY